MSSDDLNETICLSDDELMDGHWNRPPDDSYLNDGLIAGLIPDETDHCISKNSPLSFTCSPNRQQQVISSSNQSIDVNENISSHGSNANKKTSEHRYSLSQPIETNDSADGNRENDSDSQQCASTQQITEPERARDDGLLKKRRGRRALAPPKVADEFFGVYCLISRSPNKYFKNRCYIGYTVDPNRRIRQHNAGQQFGGAKRTDHRGPWDMVCIIHGFPNSVSALRFEWAWQNPEKSRRLRLLTLKKGKKESAFEFRIRIVLHMLNSDPWRKLALTFRWLLPACEINFPAEMQLPVHMRIARGLVEKTSTLVPQLIEEYICIGKCTICSRQIKNTNELLRCVSTRSCGAHFHMRCLSKVILTQLKQFHNQLFPICGKCPNCRSEFRWGDLITDQRILIAIENAAQPILQKQANIAVECRIPKGNLVKI